MSVEGTFMLLDSKFLSKKKLVFLLACISVSILSYYTYFSFRKTIWYDEAITRLVAQNSVEKTLSNSINGFDPYHSLYYLITHFLTLPFDHSLISIRAISIFATLASFFGIVILCGRILTFKIGLISGLLFSLSPAVLNYAIEARSTALVTAMVIWSVVYINRYLENQSTRTLIIFTCIVILNCYLSLFTILFWPLYLLCFYFSRFKNLKPRSLLFALIIILSTISPLFYLTTHSAGRTDWMAKDYNSINSIAHFGGLPFGESQILNFNYVPIFLIVFWTVMLVNIGRRWVVSKREFSDKEVVLLLLIWSLAPGITLMIISLFRPTYLNRYIIASIPGLMILFTVSLQSFSNKIIKNSLVMAVIVVSIFQAFSATTYQQSKDNWKQFSAPLRLNAIPGDSILFDKSCSGFFYANALADSTFRFNIVEDPRLDLNSWITTHERVTSLENAGKRVWVAAIGDNSETVSAALIAQGYQNKKDFAYSDGRKLWLYEKIN